MEQNSLTKNISLANPALVNLMSFGLRHGIETLRIKGKGPLIPFVVTERDGLRDITRFFSPDLQAAYVEGIRFLKQEKKSTHAVLVYDGFLPAENRRYNAVIVKGFDRTDVIGYSVAQRYEPAKFLSFFKEVGSRVFLGNTEHFLTA